MEQNNMLTVTYNKHITKKLLISLLEVLVADLTCKSPSLRIAIYKHNYKCAKNKFLANF